MNIYDALDQAGFSRVSTITEGGKVIEYTYFDINGVQVVVNFDFALPSHRPTAEVNS